MLQEGWLGWKAEGSHRKALACSVKRESRSSAERRRVGGLEGGGICVSSALLLRPTPPTPTRTPGKEREGWSVPCGAQERLPRENRAFGAGPRGLEVADLCEGVGFRISAQLPGGR